jgi:hypothetical protein
VIDVFGKTCPVNVQSKGLTNLTTGAVCGDHPVTFKLMLFACENGRRIVTPSE